MQDSPSDWGQTTAAPRQRDRRELDPERSADDHLLRWIAVESPDESFRLDEEDYVLDSYFNPELDGWEVLVKLEPETGDDE